MANSVVIFTIIFSLNSFALTINEWKEQILNQAKTSDRIYFGESYLEEDESEAIHEAQFKARIDMAKSFKVFIKADSDFSKNTKETTDNLYSNTIHSSTNLNISTNATESSDGINFIGLDSSKYFVNKETKVVIAAAILNLDNFEAYLRKQIKNDLTKLDQYKNKGCAISNDLKNYRELENITLSLAEANNILSTFKNIESDISKIILDQKEKIKKCRSKFKIQYVGEDSESIYEFEKLITQMGFVFEKANSRSPSSYNIKFIITKNISNPENKYEMTHVTGKVKIVLKREDGKESEWYSKTFRNIESTVERAKRGLSRRLDGEILEGIKLLSEENL